MIQRNLFMTYKKKIRECEKRGVKFIDIRFCDLVGAWQHFSIPMRELNEKVFLDGLGFDGSSIRGCKEIESSDMVIVPDINTFFIDSFKKDLTGVFIGDIYEFSKKRFGCDPRYVAKKAEEYLQKSNIANIAYLGPEAEFFIFDSAKFNVGQNFSYSEMSSSEAYWEKDSPFESILSKGNKIRNKEGYFPVSPQDMQEDIRREMVSELEKNGISVEKEHHEVASGGQAEIDIRYDSLLKIADKIMMFKYIVKNVALRNGKTATFMPKPIFGDNGSGMHIHISLWKKEKNLFYDKRGYAGLSKTALYFIGGLIKHASSLMAFAAPTVNSYKRLIPGYEAPVNLAYSAGNRSAAIRIPMHNGKIEAKRIEFRPPDPSANPYLAFSAILMAGIDGIVNRIDPEIPLDKNIYALTLPEKSMIKKIPSSLEEALAALEKDHKFLLTGEVFSENLIKFWIEYKRTAECDFVSTRINPAEFILYYNS